jgi:hypothetical protein
MRLMHMEAATFLVCETGLDTEALLIPATRLLGCRQLAHHRQGLVIPLGPTTPPHDWTIRIACDQDLFELNQPPWLEARASPIKAKGLALPCRRCAHGRPADVEPAQLAQCSLQRRPIALAVAQKDHRGPRGDDRAHQCDHGDVEFLGTMPFGTVAHAPRQGQRAPLLDHMEHQRQAATADDTALHDHHKRLERSLRQ